MINVSIFIGTVFVLVGIILFQNFWHQKRTDKIENAFSVERENYIQRLLEDKAQSNMSGSLFDTLQNATIIHEDELPPAYRDEIKDNITN